MRTWLMLLVFLVPLVVAGSARAAPWPLVSVSPADGAQLPPSRCINVELQTTTPGARVVYARVNNAPTLAAGSDRLSGDPPFLRGIGALWESDVTPGTYRGCIESGLMTPATYYWQVTGSWTQPGVSFPGQPDYKAPIYHQFASPVFRLEIVALAAPPSTPDPAPPPADPDLSMSRAQALYYSARVVRGNTGERPRWRSRTCRAVTRDRWRCVVSWRAGRFVWTGSIDPRHYFNADENAVYWTYRASVTRHDPRCERAGRRGCTRSYRWPRG